MAKVFVSQQELDNAQVQSLSANRRRCAPTFGRERYVEKISIAAPTSEGKQCTEDSIG
jgi:hypothetical protein